MLVSGIDIHRAIRRGRSLVHAAGGNDAVRARQDRLQRQMLLLTISSVVIFISTTLPANIRVIVATFQISLSGVTDLGTIITQTAILTILQSFNYGVSNCTAANNVSRKLIARSGHACF